MNKNEIIDLSKYRCNPTLVPYSSKEKHKQLYIPNLIYQPDGNVILWSVVKDYLPAEMIMKAEQIKNNATVKKEKIKCLWYDYSDEEYF